MYKYPGFTSIEVLHCKKRKLLNLVVPILTDIKSPLVVKELFHRKFNVIYIYVYVCVRRYVYIYIYAHEYTDTHEIYVSFIRFPCQTIETYTILT